MARSTQRRLFTKGILYVGLPLLVIFFLITISGLFGVRKGREFSPYTFRERLYSYHEFAGTSIQTSGLERENITSSCAQALKTKDLLGEFDADDDRWDLVSAVPAPENPNHIDASLLTDYLNETLPNGGSRWLLWTNNHPEKAKVFWPRVATLARRYEYTLIPPLFELALSSQNATELATALDANIAENYSTIAKSRRQLGEEEIAAEYTELAKKYRADANNAQ